jgi:hypothetical protein
VNVPDLISAVNAAALVVFVALSGATVFAMLLRFVRFRRAGVPVPALLKRGLVLIGAFLIIGFDVVALRAYGIILAEDSVERLVFIIQYDVIILTALGYYTKVELFDVDDPDEH